MMSLGGMPFGQIPMTKGVWAGHLALLLCELPRLPSMRAISPRFMRGLYLLLMDLNELPLGGIPLEW